MWRTPRTTAALERELPRRDVGELALRGQHPFLLDPEGDVAVGEVEVRLRAERAPHRRTVSAELMAHPRSDAIPDPPAPRPRRPGRTGATVLACGPSSPASSTNRTTLPTRRCPKAPRSTLLSWK